VPRIVRNGKTFTETIFSVTPAYLEVYANHFQDLPVDKSAETVRIEGFLFGSPPAASPSISDRCMPRTGLQKGAEAVRSQ